MMVHGPNDEEHLSKNEIISDLYSDRSLKR